MWFIAAAPLLYTLLVDYQRFSSACVYPFFMPHSMGLYFCPAICLVYPEGCGEFVLPGCLACPGEKNVNLYCQQMSQPVVGPVKSKMVTTFPGCLVQLIHC